MSRYPLWLASLCLVLAGCASAPVEQAPAPVAAPACPPVPVVECPVCEARACPGAPVVERIVEKPVPAPVPVTAGEMGLPVIGAVEWALLEPPGLRLEARIDTGAETTALFVDKIRQFEKDGQRHVLFELVDPDTGEAHEVEAELQKRVLVKKGQGGSERRYVVRMWVSLGEHRSLIDVGVSEREDYEYPLLIGRNFLTDIAIVDVSRSHLLD
jgi:hypothetical protein